MAFLTRVAKPAARFFPAIEAEEEFVEIGLDVFFPEAVIDAQRLGFHVRENAITHGKTIWAGIKYTHLSVTLIV
jgi:hypothetical protein